MSELTKEDLLRLISEHNATLAKLAAYDRVVEAAREFVYRDSEAFGRLRAALDALTGKDAGK